MIYAWLPASDRREDNYVAGFSMGGNGALKLALTLPERFAGAAVFSWAPTDYDRLLAGEDAGMVTDREKDLTAKSIRSRGGLEAFLNSLDHIWRLLREKKDEDLPDLFFACGDGDQFYRRLLDLKAWAEENGLRAAFDITPGFGHEWRFWDMALQKALRHFGFRVDTRSRDI